MLHIVIYIYLYIIINKDKFEIHHKGALNKQHHAWEIHLLCDGIEFFIVILYMYYSLK